MEPKENDIPTERRVASRWQRPIVRRLLRMTFMVGLPIILIPALLPRKVSAKKLTGNMAGAGTIERRATPRGQTLQDLVDEFRVRLGIPNPVFAVLVQENKLVVSVGRSANEQGAFTLSLEADFLEGLSEAERRAVIAHELGHVWIYTHHPFLQTEELANQIALQLVGRDVLEGVYEKVWTRTGVRGTLRYLPVE